MAISLRTLSERIERRISIENNDVQARYLPNQREIQKLANLSLDILVNDFNSVKKVGKLRKLPKSAEVFEQTLSKVNAHIKKHHHWSFWHYGALCLVTCFAYLNLLNKNKHNTTNLADPKLWITPNWEIAVLTLNYIAGRMYPISLGNLQKIGDSPDVDVKVFCELLVMKINAVTK